MPRLSVTLSVTEKLKLWQRARAHGMSMAAFMRAAALGDFSRSRSRIADEWWDGLTATRRAQVYAWLHGRSDRAEVSPGQLTLVGDNETQG